MSGLDKSSEPRHASRTDDPRVWRSSAKMTPAIWLRVKNIKTDISCTAKATGTKRLVQLTLILSPPPPQTHFQVAGQ
jgi:hypothetical protein